ncbi:MAG: hypothetical protein JRI25_23620, partial [Deltaproteobacteria bacterium]|nr:hypothetical protein [Deltaproteobacteria bacterium]
MALLLWLATWLGIALAQDCPDGEVIVVRFADSSTAPAYRSGIRAALRRLEDADGCPLFSPDGGVLDWVEVEGLAHKETEIRGLFGILEGISDTDRETRRRMAASIREHTSGYGTSTHEYLERFSRARMHLTVTQARGEGWTTVYMELRESQQLLPRNSAFTFDESTPAEREARVTVAVLELFPAYNHPPRIQLVARQNTGFGELAQVAGKSDAALAVQAGAPVEFDASDTHDPETGIAGMTFQWWVDGEPVHAPDENRLEHTFTVAGEHLLELGVSDGALEDTARIRVALPEPLQPVSETRAVQVLGQRRRVPVPVAFAVRPTANAAHGGAVGYHWSQVEGPPLTCLDVVELDAHCEEAAGLQVMTKGPGLRVLSRAPGLYRFSVVEVVDGLPSPPVAASTEALYTLSSVIRGRFDLSAAALFTVAGPLTQVAYIVEAGVPGWSAGLGAGLSFVSEGSQSPPRAPMIYGTTMQLRSLVTWVSELIRRDPVPRAGFMIAWSPSVDLQVSSYQSVEASVDCGVQVRTSVVTRS